MSSLKDIMVVDVEPLESQQAYRRSIEAAQKQASRPIIAPSSETSSPPIDDDDLEHDNTKGKTPLKRRRSNRVSKPSSQSSTSRPNSIRRRSSATGEGMDSFRFQAGPSNQASTASSPQQLLRGSEPASDVPVKYTPVTGRISRAKKGVPVHTCETCRPAKTFTRAEHLRRHQLSHQKPAYPSKHKEKRPTKRETHGAERRQAPQRATPSLKVETPLQGTIPAGNQTSPTDSMTPRTSGSGDSSITASSFSTITTNFQAVNFSAGTGSSHKRSASQADFHDADAYRPMTPGACSPGIQGNHGQLSNQSAYPRTEPQDFGSGDSYSEGGPQFPNYTATPQLLLSIPELSHTQENSPWCSSASSTYSAQSEGPRNPPGFSFSRGRSASIVTVPDWTAPHWPPHGIPNATQDLQSPAYDQIMDHYEPPSFTSPRMNSSGSNRGQVLLDVPTTFGHYYEPVGTPALPPYIKPMAHFSASPSRISNTGLASTSRRRKELALAFDTGTTISPAYAPQPENDLYISSYWQFFNPRFPIIHQPGSEHNVDSILNSAMAAIGTQYHNTAEARSRGAELNEYCRKNIELVSCPKHIVSKMSSIIGSFDSVKAAAENYLSIMGSLCHHEFRKLIENTENS